MIYYCITAGVLLLLHVMWGWACPQDVHREFSICMSNLTTGIQDDGRLGEDAYVYRRICRTLEFRKAFTCLKSLFDQCREKKDSLSLLKSLVDPDKINKAYKKMCDNMNLYEESSTCLLTQNDYITACIRNSEKAFDKESNDSSTAEEEMHAYCGYQTRMRNCVVIPVKRACGKPIGNLLANFLRGITAPACYATGSTNCASLYNALLLLVLLSFRGYKLSYT